MNTPRKLPRSNYCWRPDIDDDNDYVWRNHYWHVDNDEDEWTDKDEAGLEDYEERKRRRIAEQNEY